MAISNRWPVILVASLFPLWLGVAPSSAQTFTPVFTKQYVRAAGAPVTVSDSFTVCDPKGSFRLVVVNGPGGQGRISSGSILVAELDALLQAKWQGLKDALRQGDVNQALTFISRGKGTSYQRMLSALGSQFANIDQILTNVTFVELQNIRAEYQMLRADAGATISHLVVFALDEDGIWRLSFF